MNRQRPTTQREDDLRSNSLTSKPRKRQLCLAVRFFLAAFRDVKINSKRPAVSRVKQKDKDLYNAVWKESSKTDSFLYNSRIKRLDFER